MKQTRELLDNIRKSIGEDSMSFIVGAGYSQNISEKFPLWGELLSPLVEEYYDGAGVLVESFVLGDCHVADAPRNDVPVACALNIPAGQWHTLRVLESGTVILEMKDGAYEPISPADILSM